jgi:hypothetical protein
MLTAPRPDYLATAEERIALETIERLEQAVPTPKIPSPLAGEGQGGGEGALGEMVAVSGFTHPPTPLGPRGSSRQGRGGAAERIGRLRGVLLWNIATEYDQRLTDAYKDLRDLNEAVDRMKQQYNAFVRTRQAATQSYEGYDEVIRRERTLIASAREKVQLLMAHQGRMLETMAVDELTRRRERLEQFQVTARFAIADSYDRATKAQTEKSVGK